MATAVKTRPSIFCQTLAVKAMKSLNALQKLCAKEEPIAGAASGPGAAAATITEPIAQAFLILVPEPNRIAPHRQAGRHFGSALIWIFTWLQKCARRGIRQ